MFAWPWHSQHPYSQAASRLLNKMTAILQMPFSNGSGHEGAAVMLPGFAIKWYQNRVTRQPHLRDLTQIHFYERKMLVFWSKFQWCLVLMAHLTDNRRCVQVMAWHIKGEWPVHVWDPHIIVTMPVDVLAASCTRPSAGCKVRLFFSKLHWLS